MRKGLISEMGVGDGGNHTQKLLVMFFASWSSYADGPDTSNTMSDIALI